jgi:hypothetical protein
MTTAPDTTTRRGWLHLDGWAGRTKHPVEILGACRRWGADRYRDRLLESACRHTAGKILYPPVWAVTLN